MPEPDGPARKTGSNRNNPEIPTSRTAAVFDKHNTVLSSQHRKGQRISRSRHSESEQFSAE